MSSKPKRPGSWLTKRQMCDAMDVTTTYFDSSVRRYVRPDHVRTEGRALLFYCRGVLDSWYSRHSAGEGVGDVDDIGLELLLMRECTPSPRPRQYS
jgi:hypothetical protein